MQAVGVVAAAVVIAPILSLLLQAYGIGEATADHPNALAAPQSTLMASVAKGVFEGGLPWTMIGIGMGLAVAIIVLDLWLEKQESTFRTPVLAVAVGIYLPFQLSVPIGLGGLIAHVASRRLRRAESAAGDEAAREAAAETRATGERHGLLFAAGLITGEALVGILMAVPIVVTGDREFLAFFGAHEGTWPGVVLLVLVMVALFRVASRAQRAPG
jgi:putative OPT family oligopeptide transporter